LEGEVRVQTGRRDVRIFQDRDDISWGQEWKERIDSSLDSVTFLVPVPTPSYFTSVNAYGVPAKPSAPGMRQSREPGGHAASDHRPHRFRRPVTQTSPQGNLLLLR
jgi:hypothetical protein